MPLPRAHRSLALSAAAVLLGGLGGLAPAAASTGTFTQPEPITIEHEVVDNLKGIGPRVDIPDTGGATSALTLTPADDDAVVTWVEVAVTLDHARLSDVDLVLEAPDGRAITLASDVGGDDSGQRILRFEHRGSPPLPAGSLGSSDFTGVPTDHDPSGDLDAHPGNPPATLRALGGAQGDDSGADVWTLHAYDDTAGHVGSVLSWDLSVFYGLPGSPSPSTLAVSGMPRSVSDVNLVLSDIDTHRLSSTELLLESPDGRYAHVLSDLAEDEALSLDLTLDDQATADMPHEFIEPGVYRPSNFDDAEQSEPIGGVDAMDIEASLSAFNGGAANGTWKLWALQEYCCGTVSIGSWSLQITAENPPAPHLPPANPTAPAPTAADSTAPTVSTSTPRHHADGVRRRASIKVTFSEAMRVSSLTKRTVRLVSTSGKTVSTDLRYRTGKHRLVVDPRQRLARDTTYAVTVSTGARDVAGNRLATPKRIRFSTRG